MTTHVSVDLAEDPAIAVLLCVHRGADPDQFSEALNSLLAQTYKKMRIFLYCDGPLLPAHDACISRLLRASPGPDVVVRAEISLGLPTGLNRLIGIALEDPEVEFMARMDADDIAVPERLERQAAFMNARPEVAVSGSFCIEFSQPDVPMFHKRLPETQEDVRRAMLLRNALAHPTVMFRRKLLEKNGYRYDESAVLLEDYELWSRMICAGEVISNIPEYLLWFRINEGFLGRRRGVRRAWREIQMRLDFARRTGSVSFRGIVGLSVLFLVRISPAAVGRLAYRMRR